MLDILNYLIDNYDELYGSLSDEEFFKPFAELGIELTDIPDIKTDSFKLSDNIPYYEDVNPITNFDLICA